MPRIVCRNELFNNKRLAVEERVIRLDDKTEITRELIIKPEHYAAIVIMDNGGQVVLQQVYHYGNDQYIWGVPRILLEAENICDEYEEIERFLRKSLGCVSISAEKLLDAYEDSTIMAGRKVSFYLAKVDRCPVSCEKGLALLLPFGSALSIVTTDYMSDVFSVVALLLAKQQMQLMSAYAEDAVLLIPPLLHARVLEEKVLYRGKMFDILLRRVLLASGREQVFDIVRRDDTVLAVVLDAEKKEAVFLEEYYVGLNAFPPGLVGGHADRLENSPMQVSKLESEMQRELREEIGYRAKLNHLLSYHAAPDLTRVVHSFLATELERDPLNTGDEEYEPRVIRQPIQKLHDPDFLMDFMASEIGPMLLQSVVTP